MNKKLAWMAALALCALAILAWFIWSPRAPEPTAKLNTPPPTSEPNTVRFSVGAPQLAMIQSQDIPSSPVPLADSLSARAAYDEDMTARVGVGFSGRIVALKAAPGDLVKAGQVLAEIDSPDFGTAYADLNKARVDENHKRLIVERGKDLVPGEGIAAKDWEAAQADYAQAKAETARAEQRLKSLNPQGLPVRGQRVSLASPMSGVVTERSATPALEVSPGMSAPLFVVTDPKRLWLMIDLPEKLLGSIKLGSKVNVESDAYPEERFNATITQLGQVIDPNTRRAIVRARLDNSTGKLLPEMFVRASLLQDNGAGVRVPNEAIVNRGIHTFVFAETAPGEFHLRQVKLLTRGSNFSYVGQGLQSNDRVVTKGALLLEGELSARTDGKS